MIMKKLIQHIVACLAVASVVTTACTDDLGIIGYRPSDVICFTATLGDQAVSGISRSTSGHLAIEEEEWRLEGMATEGKTESRATIMSMLEGEARVLGYVDGTSFMDDVFQFNGDELTTTEAPVYWKDINGTNVHLYAYAPKNITDNGGLATLEGTTLKITVPADVTNQKDVIAESVQVASNHGKSVPMTFDHILTAIRFKAGFDCTVKSITVTKVANYGEYAIGQQRWSNMGTATMDYTISFGDGKTFSKGDVMTVENKDVMMLIPQTLSADSEVILKMENDSEIKASIGYMEWQPGKLITFTLYEGDAPDYIYLDLAADTIFIEGNTYSGAYYETVEGKTEKVELTNESFSADDIFYVYQSTSSNRTSTGKIGGKFVLPEYVEVTYEGKPWRDYITNNTIVENVIHAWDNEAGAGKGNADPNGEGSQGAVRKAKREATKHRIQINGTTQNVNLTIDNIYSSYQQASTSRTKGSIAFVPSENSTLTINVVGDNRLGCVHYNNTSKPNNNSIVFEGTGSLTVADTDYRTSYAKDPTSIEDVVGDANPGYYSNHWCAAIGNSDNSNDCYGIVVNSGTIFAGTTKAENCTALGAGGNGYGEVTINGGTITAVATTTGTAIGGGIGYRNDGGQGKVVINGGNVYAYNFANRWEIPSSAIGGAGTRKANGAQGTVQINAGYVYAYSALGTAIGGGSSQWKKGGDAEITISGGTVIAKSGSNLSAGIGGGTGNSGVEISENHENMSVDRNGGNAEVKINGPAVVRTGSIGGGGTGNMTKDKIGNATITISDGDIQAQCILAAGSGDTPAFTMTGGTIRNSNTFDTEYLHVKPQGGAVYLEDGKCEISGGTISNCTAETGGAIYIAGNYNETEQKYNASFTMSGGTIKECTSRTDGGAVYLKGGDMTLTGGTISDNLAQDGNGGGLYLMEGSFEMSNATIMKNSAIYREKKQGNGGGVYITTSAEAKNDVSVSILSGSITGNTSDRKGGGICVVMPEGKDADGNLLLADVTVGNSTNSTEGPVISGNSALVSGGGLYVEGAGEFNENAAGSFYGFNTRITMDNGRIKENKTTAYVPNEDVVNEKGIVKLNGGDLNAVTVTFHGNGGKTTDGQQDMFEQWIVTAANNVLVAPAFRHEQYVNLKIKSWNTRADGQGTDYTQGALINVNADIDLYAQWGE